MLLLLLFAGGSSAATSSVSQCECGYDIHYGMPDGFGTGCAEHCNDYTVRHITNRKKLDDGRVIFKAKLRDSRWDDEDRDDVGEERTLWLDKRTGKIPLRLIELLKTQLKRQKLKEAAPDSKLQPSSPDGGAQIQLPLRL